MPTIASVCAKAVLSYPNDTCLLITHIEKICGKKIMTKPTLNEIIERVDGLPPLPQALLQASQLMEDEDSDASSVAGVIKLDPELTSQVIRLCNSAAYGFSRRIETVQEGVAILGFKALKSLIYTLISHSTLNKPASGYSLEKDSLWLNALTGAVYARHIAQKYRLVDPELAFTGAILRDIGKIILEKYVGANYQFIEGLALRQKVDFVTAEEQALGFSHATVGFKIAEKWGLPERLALVIQHHHHPSKLKQAQPENFKLVTTVHLADTMTMMVGIGVGGDGLMYTLDTQALEQCNVPVSNESFELLIAELSSLNKTVREIADTLQMARA